MVDLGMQASWHLQNVQRWLLDLKHMWWITVPHFMKICHFCGKYDLFIISWTLQVLCCQGGLCVFRCWRCQLQFFISVDNEHATHVVYSIGELCFDYEGGGSCGEIWTWPWTSDKFFQSSWCWWTGSFELGIGCYFVRNIRF